MHTATNKPFEERPIMWGHADGSFTLIDRSTSDAVLLIVFKEAIRTVRGQHPSINSLEKIDRLLDYVG